MKKLFGKLSTKSDKHVIILKQDQMSSINDYVIPSIENSHTFNPDMSCGEDEWYYIEMSEEQKTEILKEFLVNKEESTSINLITPDNYQKLIGIYLIDLDSNNIIFSKITKTALIREKTYIEFVSTGNTQIKTHHNIIAFDKTVDAYFNGDNNRLYFKNFSKIKGLFKGLEIFYNEATEEQKNSFLSNTFLSSSLEDFSIIKLGSRSLRKISYLNSLGIDFSDTEIQSQYIKEANKYPELGIKIKNNKLFFNDKKQVDDILDLLTESCYTTPITNKKKKSQAHKDLN